jgi:hypothetical protein
MDYAQRFRKIMLNRMEDEVISEKFRNILGDKHPPFEILETKDVDCSVDGECNDITQKYHEECNNYKHLLEEFEQKLDAGLGLEPRNLIKQLEILNSRVNECRQGRITYMIRCCRNLENNIIAGDIGHIAYIVKLNELQSHINDIIEIQEDIIDKKRKQKKNFKKEERERQKQEIERQTQLELEENQRQTQLRLEQERLQAIQRAKIKEEEKIKEAEAAKKEKERIDQIEYQLKRERIEQAVRDAREKQKIDRKTKTEEREEQFLDLISTIKFKISNFLIRDKEKYTTEIKKEKIDKEQKLKKEKEFFEMRKQTLENLIKLLIGFYKNKQTLNKEQIVLVFWESALVDEEFCQYASEKLYPFYRF